MSFSKKIFFLISLIFFINLSSAHEAYVVNKSFFWQELSKPASIEAFNALKNTENLHITVIIILGVLIIFFGNFLLRKTKKGEKINESLEKFSYLGPIFVRMAIAASFFFSALSMSFLGPELELSGMPFPHILQAILFASSGMIAIGFLTEIAALTGLIIFTIGLFSYGLYITTYFNYLGELIVLFLFGMRKWSVDKYLFGKSKRLKKFQKYETTIVRIFYGIALMYAALTVKFLHPELTSYVATTWNLAQFHWLFPSDPLLITLGAGLAELAIGFFILIGFEMRITVLISLFYITLSLIYFRELVWPHLMLYGISLNLLVQPETFTLDHLLFEKLRARWWLRPFKAHIKKK